MTDEQIEAWKKISEELGKISPFKRVIAPKHLLDRYNETVNKENGMVATQMAFTVDKDVEVTDELIWEAMTATVDAKPLDFGDFRWRDAPPRSDRAKRSIIDY